MYSSTSAGSIFWLHIHWIFAGLALFGFIAALLWLNKHASKKDFLKIVWITLVVGLLGALLTAPAAMTGWNDMMEGHHGYGSNFDEYRTDEMLEEMEQYFDSNGDEDFDIGGMMDFDSEEVE